MTAVARPATIVNDRPVLSSDWSLRPATIVNDRPVLSSEGWLHEDYNRKGPVEKMSPVVSLKGLGAKTK
jgi:hypothetical protein